MRLVDVYSHDLAAVVLYDLLRERTNKPHVNISHREFPTWESHLSFINSRPYANWYLIEVDEQKVGAVYLTKQDEIGVQVLGMWHGRGIGKQAIEMLMQQHPRTKYYANINPQNDRSIRLFKSLGFDLLQHVYALRTDEPRTP